MNKYIIPICDWPSADIWNEVITARSIDDCQDKLMDMLRNMYRFLEDAPQNYIDFIEQCDSNDLLIGDITDIEEL